MEAKIVAITGTYKGLGAALSMLLAKKGYKLVLGGRNKAELEKFTTEIKKFSDAAAVVMDVRKKKECEHFVVAAIKKFGRLDLLINNAGIWKSASFEEVTEADLQEMFETNLFGPIYTTQAAVSIMKKQGSGHILNIGSTSAVDYKSSHVAYGASKAALVGFTGCLRTELEGTGIRVSVFSPGGMKTELFRVKPERMKEDFMDPAFVAEKIVEHIEHPTDEWHVVLRRPQKK
ncbi:SDR family oxidoreductase [Candidatus Woesearchaeota archaeon]|nr:SDR family oxidoreductase [Candidatus Woesearchaeota archaeon]